MNVLNQKRDGMDGKLFFWFEIWGSSEVELISKDKVKIEGTDEIEFAVDKWYLDGKA